MSRIIDHTGQTFGRLKVIGISGRDKNGLVLWLCQCECGKQIVICGKYLRDGTKSCGCLSVESARSRFTTHGHTRSKKPSPTYQTWCSMIGRCYNEKIDRFPYYGGRGIRICTRWRNDFSAFLEDMGERPSSHTIDRRDVNGHYSCGKCPECLANGWPMNCRWATCTEQLNNMRKNIRIEFNGETRTIAEWARHLGINTGTLYTRIRELGWSIEEALTTPLLSQYSRVQSSSG